MKIRDTDRLKPSEKKKVHETDLGVRIAVHEAGHVFNAAKHGKSMEVVLPPLTADRSAVSQEVDAATALPIAGLDDEALIDICLGGYCAERCFLGLPNYAHEPYRAANDCFQLPFKLKDPSVLVEGIPMPAHLRTDADSPGWRQNQHRLGYAFVMLQSGPSKQVGEIVLGIMSLPIAVKTLERLNSDRDRLLDVAETLFQRWKANGFGLTKFTWSSH